MRSVKNHYSHSQSSYDGCEIALTTKHNKSHALKDKFQKILNASIIEYNVDTDTLGTFSGEVTREGSAIDCARKKCEWALSDLNKNFKYAIASEGSFGPHPLFPMIACDQEILYFIDKNRDFHLHMIHISENTNYFMNTFESYEDLYKILNKIKFPSHAIIIRPNVVKIGHPIFKGLNEEQLLKDAFNECQKISSDGKVWLETDMRAHLNPSRMQVISELAEKFALRLASCCMKCKSPGWGKISQETGLPCQICKSSTEMIRYEIFGCVKCQNKERRDRSDGKFFADPGSCNYCNP